MIKKIKEKIKGFTLLYTVIIVSIIAVIVGIAVGSILKETQISRDEGESLKAFYASDWGVECVRFYQENYQALDPRTPVGTYSCGPGDSFTAGGGNVGGADCIPASYSFRLDNLDNGACTDVTIDVTPTIIYAEGTPYSVCRYYMESAGKNSCSASGSKLVERTRWENI